MTDRSKRFMNEEDIAEVIRDLPAVEPDPAFRSRLRNAFVSGDIVSSETGAERAREPHRRARSGGWRWWHWAIPVAAVVAAILVLVPLNRGPALQVLGASGSGDVRVDGEAVAIDDLAALKAEVRPGTEVEVPADGRVDIVVKDVMLYELAGGTRMTIPETPGRWFGTAVACNISVGELRLKTGVNFAGKRLRVATPEGIVEVSGTLLSIQCDSGGTCVCVVEGIAVVGVSETDMQPVKPGFRKVMLRDGTEKIIPIEPTHREGVIDFDKRVGPEIGE